MSSIIRAKAVTNSSEDEFGRVKISLEGIWEESKLCEVINNVPIKKDDIVFVDISSGYGNPLILGVSNTSYSSWSETPEGSVLFDSSDGSEWTMGYVKNGLLTIVNSSGVTIKIDKETVELTTGKSNSSSIKISSSEVNINNGNLVITNG